jgi:hypothetical protein
MAAVVLAGCYAPAAQTGAPCDLAIDNCPTGQQCMMTGSGAFCLTNAPDLTVDAPPQQGDGKPEPGCFGGGLVHDVCNLNTMTDVMIDADRVINTAMVGAPNCDSIIAQPLGGPSLCVVAANNFTIAQTAKVSAQGPNPLLLVAANTFTIAGTLDVASRANGGVVGAGAQTSCGTGNTGGTGGGPEGAGGGGAGGSFGTIGNAGGVGFKSSTNNPGGPGGTPLSAVMTPASLVGGCPGGNGGDGHGGSMNFGGPGAGGRGGGAVYIIGGASIVVSGAINASGAGGGPGRDSQDASAGGGGGGAGGFIGLDAPSLDITGSVFANGGSGGGGGGDDVGRSGSKGNDPANATTPATGGSGGQGGGGNGGAGYANGTAPTKGNNGSNPYCGGGGGGGGAGIIRVYGATPSGGTFSPAPS